MSTLENEIQALRMKLSRMNTKFQKDNEEVLGRIETLEKLVQERPGVDAGKKKFSDSVQIAIDKVAMRRGYYNK